MNLKNKLLNKFADKLKKYETPDYDYILSCHIKGEVKGVFTTIDCGTIKELENKNKSGLINAETILDEEFATDKYIVGEIVFCDKDGIACLYNSNNDKYYEDVHESFELAEERVYIKFDTIKDYETFKNFVCQNSKYHSLVSYAEEIPRKKAFDKIFIENKKNIEEDNSKKLSLSKNENYVQISGQLYKLGKPYTQKDGTKVQFGSIKQEYKYNNKVVYNKIPIMLSSNLSNDIKLNDNILVKGKLNTYTDKNGDFKSIIQCTEIYNLEKNIKKDNLNIIER